MAQETICNISDLMTLVGEASSGKPEHSHVRYWFRGHARCNWKLEPGVYRDDFKFGGTSEAERLRVEQHLTQDFRVLSAGIRQGHESDAELYFLQQHYGLPTRLLDWSNVPLAALYFAVCNHAHDESDGALYVMDAYQLATCQNGCKTVKFEGIATSRNKHFKRFVSALTEWKDEDEFPDFILPIRPDHFNPRITLQRGCFTAHPPKCQELTLQQNCTLRRVSVPKGSKNLIKKELALLGVDDFTIYGDMDHLATRLKAAYVSK